MRYNFYHKSFGYLGLSRLLSFGKQFYVWIKVFGEYDAGLDIGYGETIDGLLLTQL